ncbi:alpha/beta fold hydrolase [Thalassovita sp.]|jgi:pimeloyl-ACP methyl ester carboxylesterase|uniref:alpha/beta fold hydrolase n=1 Tax=Thalassovita sp. TaxID=1979401 RepID=UPI003B5C6208
MKTDFVTVNDTKIRYADSGGSGIPVLLSSGVTGSLEFWQPQFDALGQKLRLIAWDYPNHGLSELNPAVVTPSAYTETLLGLLDALQIEKAVLAGNSLGGTLSIRAAAAAPERVASLVLLAPAMLGKEVYLPFRLMTLPFLGEIINKPGKGAVEQQIKSIFVDPAKTTTEALREVITRNTMREGVATPFLAFLRATMSMKGIKADLWQEQMDMVSRLACPAHFIHGVQDKVLPIAQSERAAKAAPQGRVTRLEGCGHTPQLEMPDQVNAFLQEAVAAL